MFPVMRPLPRLLPRVLPRSLVALAALLVPVVVPAAVQAETCDTLWVGNQFNDRVTYCATSVLAPQAGNSYRPGNMAFQARADQAWCEGRADDGIGERVTVHYDRPAVFRTVLIANGYQKDANSYRNNARPRHVTLRTAGGVLRVELGDWTGVQTVTLPAPVQSSWLSLTIDSVYPGGRWPDTCITALGVDQEELNYR